MTSPSTPSEPVSPTGDAGPARSGPPAAAPSDVSFRAFLRAPFRALRKRADTRRAADVPSRLFHPGEIEYARLRSLPPFDSDLLILTDRRLMRVRTDGSGAVAQLSQAAPWQIESARAEDFRDHASVTIELHIGATMRLEEAASDEAQRFVATLTKVVARA
ncbi:hypothetical protein [Brevibacterium atlanticum]|uniref:hypothetical protein n=1 Tax=Brevibacterium atlanticum TaxID=2697563 RepID=UPI00141E4679|nr:hypothetical protein [Brevibacterium atlanticum]